MLVLCLADIVKERVLVGMMIMGVHHVKNAREGFIKAHEIGSLFPVQNVMAVVSKLSQKKYKNKMMYSFILD